MNEEVNLTDGLKVPENLRFKQQYKYKEKEISNDKFILTLNRL